MVVTSAKSNNIIDQAWIVSILSNAPCVLNNFLRVHQLCNTYLYLQLGTYKTDLHDYIDHIYHFIYLHQSPTANTKIFHYKTVYIFKQK